MPVSGWAAAAAAAAAKGILPALSTPVATPPHARRAAQFRRGPWPCSAKKPGSGERGAGPGSALAGVLSRGTLLRSGAALFALGFVDAGYSGDWSRIGAISKDTEELLKLGAYAVVPLCLAFVLSASSEDSSSTKS